ncbi:MAG: cation diffusion facilitator family transporter [Candidatus Nitrosotenuis sp.]
MSSSNKSGKNDNRALILNKAQSAAKQSVITLAAIGVAEILVSFFTGSITLTADGTDSIADAMISFIVWFGIMLAKKPKSKMFHFGYRKVEVLAAFIAAIVIMILGSFIAYHAFEAFYKPHTFSYPEITMATLVVAGSLSLHRAFMIRKVAIESDLISLKLDAKNSIKDGTASFIGLASVAAATYLNFTFMDAVGGMIIACYIFFMAYSAIKESALVLVDAVHNPELVESIKYKIQEKFNVQTDGVFLRPVGNEFNAEIHILLPSEARLDEIHKLINAISSTIREDFVINRLIVIPKPKLE